MAVTNKAKEMYPGLAEKCKKHKVSPSAVRDHMNGNRGNGDKRTMDEAIRLVLINKKRWRIRTDDPSPAAGFARVKRHGLLPRIHG